MIVLAKQHFAYLVKGQRSIQFTWTDDDDDVKLTFYANGQHVNENMMAKAESREFWNVMIRRLGYTKGTQCSTHHTK